MPNEEKVEISLPEGMKAEDLQKVIDKVVRQGSKTPARQDPGFVEFKDIPRGEENKLRIYRDSYKGKESFHIRNWYRNEEGYWAPGKGATFHYEEIESIIEGLQSALEWGDEHPHPGNGKVVADA